MSCVTCYYGGISDTILFPTYDFARATIFIKVENIASLTSLLAMCPGPFPPPPLPGKCVRGGGPGVLFI